jgi:hypothetical protein
MSGTIDRVEQTSVTREHDPPAGGGTRNTEGVLNGHGGPPLWTDPFGEPVTLVWTNPMDNSL